MLLKQPELVDSRRPPAVSGAWDPDIQKESVIDGMEGKYRESKCRIEGEREKTRAGGPQREAENRVSPAD